MKRGRQIKWTPERVAEIRPRIVAMRKSGINALDIARSIPMAHKYVLDILRTGKLSRAPQVATCECGNPAAKGLRICQRCHDIERESIRQYHERKPIRQEHVYTCHIQFND